MPYKGSSARIVWVCLATMALFDACSFDESKLRRPTARDAASAPDVADASDAQSAGRDDVAASDGGRPADVPPGSGPDGLLEVRAGDAADGAAGDSSGGLGGEGGSGGSPGWDGGADGTPGSGGQGGAPEAGVPIPMDAAGPADDGSAGWAEIGVDSADAPSAEDTTTDDREGQSIDAPAEEDVTGPAADGLAASDRGNDTVSVDARGKKTCPSSLSGSLDGFDSTQTGRLSRKDSASVCGTAKEFPGNGADKTYPHLYDVYHFINVASTPVCFTFTLTYSSHQELSIVAYSAFDPTDITARYLGDAGDTLAAPQTIGITVGAGETIDVVVSAVAIGTTPAGSYTLSCSIP